ncbi:50S ribosomal protein L25 [Bacillus sp. B15-48]|uniref:50S ribosomal protein L25 n=1 Tax=Bacillus sp. B15-48 TaxID=1548601 RepID=UPI00193F6E46|nr:50S ribosomal protein L25 [Bacillus sp. B15-48]MBM4763178.1 50S ribosomal protein L25 [Bacillus sp. B15-48]
MNTLEVQVRQSFKRSALKKLRNDGKVPAIVYGRGMNTESISMKNAELQKVIKKVGRNGIFPLHLNGKSINVILRDYQSNPVTKDLLHVDFLQVDKHTEIDTKVSVILKGSSKGEKAGGIVKQFLHELDLTAKANDIPDTIEIDTTDFEIGHSVRVSDIKKAYSNCTFKQDDDETIVMVDYVKAHTEEEEEAAEVETTGV